MSAVCRRQLQGCRVASKVVSGCVQRVKVVVRMLGDENPAGARRQLDATLFGHNCLITLSL